MQVFFFFLFFFGRVIFRIRLALLDFICHLFHIVMMSFGNHILYNSSVRINYVLHTFPFIQVRRICLKGPLILDRKVVVL